MSKSDDMGYVVTGKSVPRYDAVEKVIGTARYPSDMYNVPGLLQGKILRSPHGYAKINSIDTSKAGALPGVVAVVTWQDAPNKVKWYPDRLIFGKDYVYRQGYAVAAVAAETEEIAEQALDLIKVDYTPLQGMYSQEDAMKAGAPVIINLPGGNQQYVTDWKWNEVDPQFASSYLVLEDDYRMHSAAAASQACSAEVDYWDANGMLHQFCSSQGADNDLNSMASLYSLPLNKIVRDSTYSQGSFGPTHDMHDEGYICPCLAKKAGRPLMIAQSKEDMMRDHHINQGATMHLKMGFTKEGVITALEISALWDGGCDGAPNTGAGGSMSRSPFFLHHTPATHSKYSIVFNNTTRKCNWRGLSCIDTHLAIEGVLEQAAEQLGVSVVDMHLKNTSKTGDIIFQSGLQPAQQPTLTMADCAGTINYVANSLDFKNKWKGWKTPVSVDGDKRRGLGMAEYVHTGSGGGGSHAAVKVARSGEVELYCLIPDPGTGCKTIACQMCAETLGVKYENVRIAGHDTTMPRGGACRSSKATVNVGSVVVVAARKIKAQVLAAAATLLKVTAAELDSKNGLVFVKADPTKNVTWAAACGALTNEILEYGVYPSSTTKPPPCSDLDPNKPQIARNYGTDGGEVEVDMETGEVLVKKWAVGNDCGLC